MNPVKHGILALRGSGTSLGLHRFGKLYAPFFFFFNLSAQSSSLHHEWKRTMHFVLPLSHCALLCYGKNMVLENI
jgi:hypothetical protein